MAGESAIDAQGLYEAVTADSRWEDAIALTEQDAKDLNDQLIEACGMVNGDQVAPFIALRLLEQREDLRREVQRLRYQLEPERWPYGDGYDG